MLLRSVVVVGVVCSCRLFFLPPPPLLTIPFLLLPVLSLPLIHARARRRKSNLFDAVQFVLLAPRFANLRQVRPYEASEEARPRSSYARLVAVDGPASCSRTPALPAPRVY